MVDILAAMAIARLPLIAIDCPDPGALARFYRAMLDWKIEVVSAERASVCPEDGQCSSARPYPSVQSHRVTSGLLHVRMRPSSGGGRQASHPRR
jgi:hypothetical protein